MSYRTPITEADLHAYVDGQLSAVRRQEVEAYLVENPEAAAQVKYYRDINQGLRALYDPVLSESLPPQLNVVPRPRRWPVRAATALAWVALGAVLGWALKPATQSTAPGPQELLAHPAAYAHRVYAVEKSHPVEVSAENEQHLIKWLSRRLDTPHQGPEPRCARIHACRRVAVAFKRPHGGPVHVSESRRPTDHALHPSRGLEQRG